MQNIAESFFAAFGGDLPQDGLFIGGGRTAEESGVHRFELLVRAGGSLQALREFRCRAGEGVENGTIDESECLRDRSIRAGILDELAIALAEGAQEGSCLGRALLLGGTRGKREAIFASSSLGGVFHELAALLLGHVGE